MKRTLLIMGLVVCLLAPLYGADKKRVAIIDFDFAGVQRWWDAPNWDIGAGICDLVVKNLVRDGTFSVIERRALDAILAEQNFSNSDRASAATAAKIGQMLGVDAIVIGSITQFGTEEKKLGIGGIGGRLGGFGGGKVGTSKGKAKVAIDARVINVNTGEILAVADGTGESSRSGLLLEGAGGGGGGFGAGGIDMGSSDFRETILGEAVAAAVDDLSGELIESDQRIPQQARKLKGLIAYAEGGLIIINIGSSAGVRVGDELIVARVKSTVKDPATGKVLREITEEVGKIRITSVDEGSAEATVVSGADFKVGDVVKN